MPHIIIPILPTTQIEYNIDIKIKIDNDQIVKTVIPFVKVVNIPGKVPVTVTETNINDTEFGIIFGGQKFKSLSTWAGLNLNQGMFFIKLVDPTGILTGKTFKAKTYFGSQISSQEIDVTID